MMARVDPDPSNRVLPLGLGDLERWEAWLRETHPEQADRLLPTGPDLFGHYYFRFGLDASPAEIGASIEEYLESRDPLVGTYVCSEAGNPDSAHTGTCEKTGRSPEVPMRRDKRNPRERGPGISGRLFTNFEGGMTWFAIQGDRLVLGAWTCTPGISR